MTKTKFDDKVNKENGLHKDYRKDWRTDEQFEADIKKAHKVEHDIIEAFAKHLELTYNRKFVVEDNGIDNSGKVLDLKDVDTRADYKINGVLVEVKFNNNMMDEFRFKKSQLNSYLKQGAYVLWVNGWETDSPVWTLLDSDDLKEIKRTRQPFPYAYWGHKLCYNLKSYSFTWKRFKGVHNVTWEHMA
jgi:hypothetical protein